MKITLKEIDEFLSQKLYECEQVICEEAFNSPSFPILVNGNCGVDSDTRLVTSRCELPYGIGTLPTPE